MAYIFRFNLVRNTSIVMNKEINYNEFPGIIEDDFLHKAAVIIPIVKVNGENHILFEIRSGKVNSQKGDACFPGGSIETNESPMEAAIRECTEELLVKEDQIEILRPLRFFHRLSLEILPYLAILHDYDGKFDEEVAEVFTVPLKLFIETEPEKYITKWEPKLAEDFPVALINEGVNYAWPKHKENHLFYKYDDRIIWGYTAKMIYHNLDLIKDGLK